MSIVAVIKDEAPYLREWIEFHKLVGVTRFYLYDAATDNTREVLSPYIESGEVVYRMYPGKAVQIRAYNDALCRYRNTTRWMAIIDADEFLAPVGQCSTVSELLRSYEDFPAVAVNWIAYDSNGHVTKPDGLVLRNYTRVHADENCSGNRVVKSIVNPRKVVWCGHPHYCHYSPFGSHTHAVTENYDEVTGPRTAFNSTKKIRVCHYYSKSLEEFERKCRRGMADTAQFRSVTEEQYNFPETKEDLTMIRYADLLEGRVFRS